MSWQTLAPVLFDAFASSSRAPVLATAAARVGDPEATRTVYVTIVVLIVLGIVLMALALWVFRRTRPEAELLAPLETMQTRKWRKLNPAGQRRLLDESRPADAVPLHREASPPAVDSSFATVAPVTSFDDLSAVEIDDDETASSAPEPDGPDEANITDHDATVESARRIDAADERDVDEPDEAVADEAVGNESDVDEAEADEPDIDEPDIDEPDIDEPEADEPEADEPEADEPEADEPEADEPEADEPEADEPEADEPEADIDEPDEAPLERSIDPLLTPRRRAPARD